MRVREAGVSKADPRYARGLPHRTGRRLLSKVPCAKIMEAIGEGRRWPSGRHPHFGPDRRESGLDAVFAFARALIGEPDDPYWNSGDPSIPRTTKRRRGAIADSQFVQFGRMMSAIRVAAGDSDAEVSREAWRLFGWVCIYLGPHISVPGDLSIDLGNGQVMDPCELGLRTLERVAPDELSRAREVVDWLRVERAIGSSDRDSLIREIYRRRGFQNVRDAADGLGQSKSTVHRALVRNETIVPNGVISACVVHTVKKGDDRHSDAGAFARRCVRILRANRSSPGRTA